MNVPVSTLLERKGSKVFTIPPTLTVFDAVAEMNRHRIGAIVILDGARLAGIFTERDVLRRIVGAGLDPRRALVSDVMTADVLTIHSDATLDEATAIFTEKRCRHLPVVDGGKLVGLVSIGDITRWVGDAHRAEAEQMRSYISGGMPA